MPNRIFSAEPPLHGLRLADRYCPTEINGPDVAPQGSPPSNSTIDRLVSAYQDYCELQTSKHDAQSSAAAIHRLVSIFRTDFPSDLAGYQQMNDRLYDIWKRHIGRADPENYRICTTTGSTRNAPRKYRFGPYPYLWKQAIWNLTRFPLGWRTVVNLDSHLNENTPFSVQANPSDICQYLIDCGPFRQQLVTELLDAFRQLLSEYPAISVISVPDSFLYLNRQPAFQEFVIDHRDQINLMSQHWEPFYARKALQTQGVHINDALGDWTTGLFYYTCRAGFLHTYPTFATSGKDRVNLLNLMQTPELGPGTEEDLFEPVSVSACLCGRNRVNFRLLPHQAAAMRPPRGGFLYAPELADHLMSSFLSLQFIQEGETLLIRYRVEGEMRDQDLLEDYFRPHGFQIRWQPNDVYLVGAKRPVFYRYPG